MFKLRTIVVDDESLARQLMLSCLAEIPEIDVQRECSNGREAVVAVLELEPDLMFLDISMPGLNGFEVIKKIQPELLPMVIFCTAYQRYAIDAFDLHAVDYLLKPVDGKRLQRAIARARERLREDDGEAEHKSPLVGAIDEIAKKVYSTAGSENPQKSTDAALAHKGKIAIKDNDSTVLLEPDDIDWVDAAGDYMCVHVKGETLIMRSTLKNLMSRLDQEKFKRIHRSTIVNLDRIVKATPLTKGEYILDLQCDQQLKVSRNYRQAIKLFLSEK